MADEIVDEAVAEVKGSFDLGGLLKGRPSRFKSVKLYIDEQAGEELGGNEPQTNILGQVTGYRRWGVIGQLEDLRDELNALPEDSEKRAEVNDKILALAPAAQDALARLEASALTVEIQSLPPIIQDEARRKARKELGIKGKLKQDDERIDDYFELYNKLILERCVVSITNAAGEKNGKLDRDGVELLVGYLPTSEVAKLSELVGEVVFKSSIAAHLATDADF